MGGVSAAIASGTLSVLRAELSALYYFLYQTV